MSKRLLIVDDDARIRASLTRSLREVAGPIETAGSAEEALARVAAARPDVVLSDVRMPGMDGMELLRLLRQRASGVDVILMTAFDELPLVAAAMQEGATDFLVKPLDLHHLRRLLERVFEDRAARAARGAGRERAAADRGPEAAPALVGRDPRMVEIFKVVGQVAGGRTNVVIRGESGTGKELIALAIHDASPYRAEPFAGAREARPLGPCLPPHPQGRPHHRRPGRLRTHPGTSTPPRRSSTGRWTGRERGDFLLHVQFSVKRWLVPPRPARGIRALRRRALSS